MFNYSLTTKSALAAASFPLFALAYWFVEEVWPRTVADPPDWFAQMAFGCLIGICVLVPQINSKSYFFGRALILAVGPAIIAGVIEYLDSTLDLQQLLFFNSFHASMVAYWLFFSIFIAALTVLVSPLKAHPRLWILTGASGLIFGLGLIVYLEMFFCLFGSPCVDGYDWVILPIGLMFPMSLSLSFHFGAADHAQN